MEGGPDGDFPPEGEEGMEAGLDEGPADSPEDMGMAGQEEEEFEETTTLAEIFGHGSANNLQEAYLSAIHSENRKPNYLVERCILESKEAGQETFFIEAPGNQPLVFSTRLIDADMTIFSEIFNEAMPFLSHLDLSYNHITDEGVSTLAVGLLGSRARRLMVLSLRGNSIGPAGCDKLCDSVRKCPQLQCFDLSQNQLGRAGGLMVVELVQQHEQLLEIHLADTEIDIDVLVAFSAVLLTEKNAHMSMGPKSKLQVVNLENPRISTLQEDHTVHIGRMLRADANLREIYLGKHKMRDDGVRQLVSFLLENKTLRVLDLRCNELGAEGAKHLGTLLRTDCQLTQLNISGNRIGEKCNVDGARELAEALTCNRMLKHIDLNNNMLCGEALQFIASAVDQNSTLESIAIFHNDWDQLSSYKFHQILNDRARILPVRADFTTAEVDLRIDICLVPDFKPEI